MEHSVPLNKVRDLLLEGRSSTDRQYREIATRCWETGDDIRAGNKGDSDTCLEAIEWLQRALHLVECLQKRMKPVKWVKDLNIAIHKSLGESFYLPI
jgi:hypothetical protein